MRLYQTIIERVLLPAGDRIFGSSFTKELKDLRRSVSLPEAGMQEQQRAKLGKLLDFAVIHSPYYKSLGVLKEPDPERYLKKFPVLDKQLVRTRQQELLTEPVQNLFKHGSSGSSGIQTTVYWSGREQDINRATQALWWEWAGFKLGDPVLQTGINPKRVLLKKLKDIFLRTYYLQAFAHNRQEAEAGLAWAAKFRHPILAGYASSLYVLAVMAEQFNIQVRFRSAISWGDKLFEHYRQKIEHVFKTRVFETYASAEGLMIAAQRDLPYMYIMTSNVFVEIVDDHGNEVPDGTMGHVLVTNLNAYAMPLIRYKIGDLAIKLPRELYPPERELSFPLLERVVGRDTDLVKTISGKYMVVHSFTGIFEHIPQIRQFKVIQESLEGITIQFIKGEGFDDCTLPSIRQAILNHLKEDFKIVFDEVEEIAPSPSGKPQIIESKIQQ